MYVYISVASETGHVAVSFLQLREYNYIDIDGDPFPGEVNIDGRYTNYIIYRTNETQTLEIPFEGRAVFTKDKLVLVRRETLDIYMLLKHLKKRILLYLKQVILLSEKSVMVVITIPISFGI
jgi:hypothetical protein